MKLGIVTRFVYFDLFCEPSCKFWEIIHKWKISEVCESTIDILYFLIRFCLSSVYLVARLGIWRGDMYSISTFRLSLYPGLRWRLDARERDWSSCHEMLREEKLWESYQKWWDFLCESWEWLFWGDGWEHRVVDLDIKREWEVSLYF
jgi:hypothetical protein